MNKYLKQGLVALGLLAGVVSYAQVDDKYKDYREVYRDSVLVANTKEVFVQGETDDPFQVVSNPFRQNWFVFGTAGVHSFRGRTVHGNRFPGLRCRFR